MTQELLTRDKFRHAVFKRDGYKCVICGEPAIFDKDGEPTNLDSHHVIERRLFSDGGYYIDNGASLCPQHHIKAEETTLSCEEIRTAAGITHIIIPDHLYDDAEYDKWGNIILPNGTRLKGELWEDESVQKIIKPVVHEFSKYIKYPRTYHLPWSTRLKDDRKLETDEQFVGKRVIATIKMDGENTTMYNDYLHARSINSGSHESRNWVKGLWSQIGYQLGEDLRLCGENLYAKHSVEYTGLKSYFNLFSVWNNMTCLCWEETTEYATLLGLELVPVIFQGIYDSQDIIKCYELYSKFNSTEGYVIRLEDEFKYVDFRKSVAKYVKPEFKQAINNSHGHWISQKIVPNKLSL